MKKLLTMLAQDMLGPLGRRAGTFAGALVAGYDLGPDMVVQVEGAVALLAGVLIDLALSRAFRVDLTSSLTPPARKARAPKAST